MTASDVMFYRKILGISAGWKVWHTCIKKYHMKEDAAFVALPSGDFAVNQYAMLYLDDFLTANHMQSAVLAVTHRNRSSIHVSLSRKVEAVEAVSDRQMKGIIDYYCACNPDKRLVIADIDSIPVRKKLRRLIGVNGTALEHLMAAGVYGMASFEKAYGTDARRDGIQGKEKQVWTQRL